jgi:ABC-type multidrug transport system fused ATPase/permease subunit
MALPDLQRDDAPPPCFDASRASGPTRRVRLERVVDLLVVSHAGERIADYQAAMRRGDRFPPVAVVRWGERFLVADGHKRLSAFRALGGDELVVEVWSWRRWVRDQAGQLTRKTRQQWNIARRIGHDPAARQEARRLAWDTVGHWQRALRSLRARWRSDSAADRDASRAVFRRLVHDCLAFRGRLALAVASLVTLSGAQLALTWLVKQWADGPLAGDAAAVAPLLRASIAVTAVLIGAVFVSRYVLDSVSQRLVERLRNRALARVLALRLDAAQQTHSGELASRILTDTGALAGFVGDVLKRLVGEGLVIVGALAMAFALQWRLALLTLTVVPAVIGVLAAMGSVIRRRSRRAQAAVGDLTATLHDVLRGLSTIKGFNAEAHEQARFAARNRHYRHAVLRGEWSASLLVAAVWILTGTGMWAILWYGTSQVLAGTITAGGLFAFCLYLLQTLEPLRRLSDVQGLLQRNLAAAARVYELIDAPAVETGGACRLEAPTGVVALEAVSFRYRDETPVLRDLTLQLAPGAPIGLVAASGGGKSTLAKLLVRFAEPQSGGVRLDGVPLRELDLAALRRAVCVVEQEPFLFSGSVLDNVRYGAAHASRQRIEAALAAAGLTDVVRALPAGIETPIAEAGRSLSVGQKQRLALARAILRAPSVLVLDEATSALDSETEAQIFTQLDGWLRQRTTLVIAHRLSTIARFERVLVLENGRVVGDGSVAELHERCPAFSRLFADQLAAAAVTNEMGF